MGVHPKVFPDCMHTSHPKDPLTAPSFTRLATSELVHRTRGVERLSPIRTMTLICDESSPLLPSLRLIKELTPLIKRARLTRVDTIPKNSHSWAHQLKRKKSTTNIKKKVNLMKNAKKSVHESPSFRKICPPPLLTLIHCD
ncbi:hypothetical protein ACE6H2_006396 [Prunus campanulata]